MFFYGLFFHMFVKNFSSVANLHLISRWSVSISRLSGEIFGLDCSVVGGIWGNLEKKFHSGPQIEQCLAPSTLCAPRKIGAQILR
jgi:hypothetical protein